MNSFAFFPVLTRRFSLVILCMLIGSACLFGEEETEKRGLNGLTDVPFDQLSEKEVTQLGKAALAIRDKDWKHAETAHFIFHFFHGFVASRVSSEMEFYYNCYSQELKKDTSQWQRKCHVFVFEQDEDWRAFLVNAKLDPWTGGLHSRDELFIQRNPQYKFKGNALGHETAHLVLYRFFGPGIPLWLNEGYAENASMKFYAQLEYKRGYLSKPHSEKIEEADYIPIKKLNSMVEYPEPEKDVVLFYAESEKAVNFLRRQGIEKLSPFIDALAKGGTLENALWNTYGSQLSSMEAFDREFKSFAISGYEPLH